MISMHAVNSIGNASIAHDHRLRYEAEMKEKLFDIQRQIMRKQEQQEHMLDCLINPVRAELANYPVCGAVADFNPLVLLLPKIVP